MPRWIAIVAVVLATTAPARADDESPTERARELASEAQGLAVAGDYFGAAAKFKAALALDPLPDYQCNVGVAYWKAHDLPRAHLFLDICTSRGSSLPESWVIAVRDVLVEIERDLRAGDFAPVEVIVTPAAATVTVSTFALDDTFVGSRTVWLPFGEHRFSAAAPGHEDGVAAITITTRDPAEVRIPLVEIPPPPAPVIEEQAPVVIVERGPPSRKPAYLMAGLTGLAVVLDVFLYASAHDSAQRAGRLPAGIEYDNAADLARARRNQLYAMYGVTAGCAAATAYLWWRARPRSRASVTVDAGAGGASISIGGRF